VLGRERSTLPDIRVPDNFYVNTPSPKSTDYMALVTIDSYAY